jgi:acetyl esterase/lipase
LHDRRFRDDDGCEVSGGIAAMRGFLAVLAIVVLGGGVLTSRAEAQKVGVWSAPGHEVITIWPNGVPKSDTPSAGAAVEPEEDIGLPKDSVAGKPKIRLTNVSVPTLTVYKAQGTNTGVAVVVFPGGGYKILSIDLEGTEVCDWLSAKGITCFILKYRVPDSGPYPKYPAAMEDAQRAVGIVWAHAAEWKVDPKKIGVLGFSAGGHLAVALSTHFDKRVYAPVDAADQVRCRPDFAVIAYPAYLTVPDKGIEFTPDIAVTKEAPPTFLVQAEDDPVHVENAVAYFMELKKAGVQAEMHLYAKGGHGYGLRKTELPITEWPTLVDVWLQTIGMVPKG